MVCNKNRRGQINRENITINHLSLDSLCHKIVSAVGVKVQFVVFMKSKCVGKQDIIF